SIVNEEGVEAGITVTSGVGITINAGPSDTVNPRGLTLVGGGVGNNGISFISRRSLNIQNCVIRGFASTALNLQPTVSSDINVSSTIVSGNGTGINLAPSGTNITVTASFEQVQAIHNAGDGFAVFGGLMRCGSLHTPAADSLASGNGGAGFVASTVAGQGVTIFTLTNSKATNNQTGVVNNTGTATFLNGSTISGNSFGFAASDGGV